MLNTGVSYVFNEDTATHYDTSERVRVSQLTTLFDGKTLTVDDTDLWTTIGTGTAVFDRNHMDMSVTAGQYEIRQSNFYSPYFSGKPQFIELTFDTFGLQSGVVKRIGYFSSSAVAPYTANFDGWYIEADGVNNTYKLCVLNNGTFELNLDWTQWDNYSRIKTYDWNNFTVMYVDFLWLGGAALRLFLKSPSGGFILCHTFNYAGSAVGPFMDNPQLPVRYELRSTTGAGSLNCICNQVASEGSISERGKSLSVYTTAAIACNNVGTIYALRGVRKTATYRNTCVRINGFGGAIAGATTDAGMLLLIKDPTLSAPLTWTNNSKIQDGAATAQTVTAGTGRIIATAPLVSSSILSGVADSMLAELSINITNTASEYVLAYTPYTINQTLSGTLTVLEY